MRLDVARGEKFSFQVAVIPDCPLVLNAKVNCAPGLTAIIRRVGYVPLLRRNESATANNTEGYDVIPGLVPDPLYDDFQYTLPPRSASAFWISGMAAPDCRPGLKKIQVVLASTDLHRKEAVTLTAGIQVHPVRLRPRSGFDVTHWFYADALCDWYKADPWTEDFWRIVPPYIRNVAAHGQNVLYVPVFTPPLDGVKRPTQLLGVRRTGKDKYAFDWSQVRRWIRTARQCGIEKFEWCHLFTQWGARFAIRIYQNQFSEDTLLWPPETPGTGEIYRAFLAQFLPQLHRFLLREKLLDRSLFHLSDEPHGDEHLESYRQTRAMLRELAPWMKVMDALSDIRFAKEKLVDMPVPSIRTAKQFWAEQIPCWHYYCCSPRGDYLNRHLETPLALIRMSGWLFYRFQARGFLHWGYNYWYKSQTRQLINPFFESDGLAAPGWVSGDPFVVYPGPNGPLDSIRWEVFAESLQDYQLLQTLNISPEKLAGEFVDYNQFPKSAAWLRSRRRRLLQTK
ncbi:MAG: DUF4091 domain-containing protein [Kiritimatiellae bacterium]|nr:DUF4091 domain-containing protein [Kiritimatiellia bacterium]